MVHERKIRISIIWTSVFLFAFLMMVLWFTAGTAKADAKVDEFVIATNDNGDIWYLQSGGDGSFADRVKITTIGSSVRGVGIADFDNDTDYDFVTGDSSGKLYLFKNTGSGTFSSTNITNVSFGTPPYCMDFAVADFNKDGYYDFIVSGNNNNIEVFMNNKNSTFNRTTISVSWASYLTGKDAGNYDGDGFNDFIVTRWGGEVYIYSGNGTSSFVGRSILNFSLNSVYALTSGDFNNDGNLDIVFGGSTNGRIYLYQGSGNGNFTFYGEIYNFGSGPAAVDSYDFNGDGNEDVVVAAYNSTVNSTIYLLRGKGNDLMNVLDDYISVFELGTEYKTYLINPIPNELKTAFENHNYILDDSATITTIETDKKWEIKDRTNTYGVKSQGTKLKISVLYNGKNPWPIMGEYLPWVSDSSSYDYPSMGYGKDTPYYAWRSTSATTTEVWDNALIKQLAEMLGD